MAALLSYIAGDKNSTRPLVITNELDLERTSNSSQSTHPVGQVLLKKFLEEVVLHITQLCSLLHTLLKDMCMCLQDK